MNREITTHKVNGVNDGLKLTADERGHGNASHKYHVTTEEYPPPVGGGMSSEDLRKAQSMLHAVHDIRFQNGTIPEVGINGLTNEVLLAIVADRLEGFQSGPFKCQENQAALDAVIVAMGALKSRTEKRLARGVEGTHKP